MTSSLMPKRLALLGARNRGGTSDYARQGLEDALTDAGLPVIDNDAAPARFLGKALKTLKLQRAIFHRSASACVVVMVGPEMFRAFPQGYTTELITYAFDCWPADYDLWERFLRAHRMSIAFFSARQSACQMAARIPGLDAIWLPEGIDPRPYRADIALSKRHIDLLELGRRSEVFHEHITAHCVRRNYVHCYQRSATSLIFTDRAAFLDGIAQSRILACFPSSMTHPERSGDVETLTLRYLEGMASGCILLGRCPKELRTLFGYDPVVAADLDNPGEQLDMILANPDAYTSLIERNSRRLREVGTWDSRVLTMLTILNNRGYYIDPTRTR